jgi:23S rRNA (cytidine1920-2'-O)/16S rRNA (cytidine1409-2'-O)-methyltransferase
MATRMRIDKLLVDRGLFESRAKAQAAIAAGQVTADDAPVRKPSEAVSANAVIGAKPEHPYVSRGGLKLAAALEHFGFDPAGRVCLDVGASTGGFTDVLLRRGARRIYALDVGHGQLHASMREKSEVVSLEGTDIRNVPAAMLPDQPELVTIDVSFISLKLVMPAATALVRRPAQLVALIKPQFEAGRGHAKKGIVRDAAVHSGVCDDLASLATTLGWRLAGVIPSPIAGGDGNREFLLGALRD